MIKGRIKQKLSLMSQPGVSQVFVDLLVMYDNITNTSTSLENHKTVIAELKKHYLEQIGKDRLLVQTRDIEDLIAELKRKENGE